MDKAPQLERTDWGARKVTYRYYDNVEEPNSHGGTSTHLKLVRATVRVGEFIKLYREKLKYFVYHRGMVRLTSRIRVQRMGAMRPGDALIIMDFSEKLNKEKRKEAQSEHWVNTTMTIEVAVAESWRPDLSDAERDAVLARLLCELALRLNLTLDQMNEVTGHGKDEADGHGGVFKNWLLSQMHAASLVKREFKTYEEKDITNPPEVKPMTAALAADAPGAAHRAEVRAARRLRALRVARPAQRLEEGRAAAVRARGGHDAARAARRRGQARRVRQGRPRHRLRVHEPG